MGVYFVVDAAFERNRSRGTSNHTPESYSMKCFLFVAYTALYLQQPAKTDCLSHFWHLLSLLGNHLYCISVLPLLFCVGLWCACITLYWRAHTIYGQGPRAGVNGLAGHPTMCTHMHICMIYIYIYSKCQWESSASKRSKFVTYFSFEMEQIARENPQGSSNVFLIQNAAFFYPLLFDSPYEWHNLCPLYI